MEKKGDRRLKVKKSRNLCEDNTGDENDQTSPIGYLHGICPELLEELWLYQLWRRPPPSVP